MSQLPAEVIDMIITQAVNSPTYHRDCLLSKLANVSRRWRHLVNHRRFKCISVKIGSDSVVGDRSLQTTKLAHLILSKIWANEEGVAQHVRHLCLILQVGLHPQAFPDQIEELTTITRTIFRGMRQSVKGFTSLTNKLSLLAESSWHKRMFNFDILDPRIVSAIKRICRRPALAELELNRIENIPRSLLCSIRSPMLSLSLFDVKFSPWEESQTATENIRFQCHLKSLHCSANSDIFDVFLQKLSEEYYPESICFRILNVDDHNRVLNALHLVGRNLKGLALQYYCHNVNEIILKPVDYARIGPLTSLSLYYEIEFSWMRHLNTIHAEQTPILATALNTVPDTVPSKLHIEIAAIVSYFTGTYSTPEGGAKALWMSINHSPFIDYLKRGVSETLGHSITIILDVRLHCGYRVTDVESFEKEFSEALYLLFKPMKDIKCLLLSIYVTVID